MLSDKYKSFWFKCKFAQVKEEKSWKLDVFNAVYEFCFLFLFLSHFSSCPWTSITYFYLRLILECASLHAHIPVRVPSLPLSLFPFLRSALFSHLTLCARPLVSMGTRLERVALVWSRRLFMELCHFSPPPPPSSSHSFSQPIYLFIPPCLMLSTSVRQLAYGFCGFVRARPHMFQCSLPAGRRRLCERSAAQIRLCSPSPQSRPAF